MIVLRPTPLMLALAAALPLVVTAAPGSNSPYRSDAQSTHVEDATSRGIAQVNMISCFMAAMKPDALVNKGNYIALVDENKCDPEARASSANSGAGSSASNAPSYVNAIVNSTRASNSEPMRTKVWIDQKEDGFSGTIFVNLLATTPPSESNPYGVFRLDYCGKPDGGGSCLMRGFLQGAADGISYFEIEGMGGGQGSTKALRLTASGSDAGAGALSMDEGGHNAAYAFAYNSNYFRRADDSGDRCFSRDAQDPDTGMSIWRYGLYDASSGERIERMSGFPVDYSAPNGTVYHGHMGYWGLNFPPDANVPNGATVQRVEYAAGQAPTKTDYTLLKAAGRLTKYTKRTRTLASMDKIRFQTWIGNAAGFYSGAQSNRQYELYWDDAAGQFKVSATIDCDNGPCESRDLSVTQSVQTSFFASMGGVRGWSQSLGGEVFVPLPRNGDPVQSSAVDVVYRTPDLVYPAQMPATLYCLRDCPTAATIADYFGSGSSAQSPFVASSFNNWTAKSADQVVTYTTQSTTALLRDGTGAAVTFTDRNALDAHPQYQWGVRSGRMVDTLSVARCQDNPSQYCDWMLEQADVFYQWETGPAQWNQFATLQDANGQAVAFQAPLQVNYTVPGDAAYGAYAGKTIVLQYGGFGELWGIPGQCVSRQTNERVSCDTAQSRYVPAFAIPFDETLGRVDNGGTPLLVKWLEREIRFARKDLAVCTGAGLALSSGLTLPDAGGLVDPTDPSSPVYIGAKPTVTDGPRVMHGEVKY